MRMAFSPTHPIASLFPNSTIHGDSADIGYPQESGLYRTLYPRLMSTDTTAETKGYLFLRLDNKNRYLEGTLKLYRSRTWVFLDDASLYKTQGEGPHFPAQDVAYPDISLHDIIGPRWDPGPRKSWHPMSLSPEVEVRELSRVFSLKGDDARISRVRFHEGVPTAYSHYNYKGNNRIPGVDPYEE
ncbi:hypothetical protein F5Y18DRAFT_144203 [Xylariaceae sp. FL1019]|nr:hypothetical protein F5Y18DRAFT_144203 [Xylariaceae sp. FL1019]